MKIICDFCHDKFPLDKITRIGYKDNHTDGYRDICAKCAKNKTTPPSKMNKNSNPKVIELSQEIQGQIEEIAKRNLHVETLHVRNRDSLDFYDVSVRSIRDALVEAYNLGKTHK